jgi:hypothetical protein
MTKKQKKKNKKDIHKFIPLDLFYKMDKRLNEKEKMKNENKKIKKNLSKKERELRKLTIEKKFLEERIKNNKKGKQKKREHGSTSQKSTSNSDSDSDSGFILASNEEYNQIQRAREEFRKSLEEEEY